MTVKFTALMRDLKPFSRFSVMTAISAVLLLGCKKEELRVEHNIRSVSNWIEIQGSTTNTEESFSDRADRVLATAHSNQVAWFGAGLVLGYMIHAGEESSTNITYLIELYRNRDYVTLNKALEEKGKQLGLLPNTNSP